MSDQNPTEGQQPTWPGPQSILYAPPIVTDEVRRMNDERMRQEVENRERAQKIDAAFRSPAAQKIRDVVMEDGNITDWREFVRFCGGILEVVKMVDAHGFPDTGRIIPKVDELFNEHVQEDIKRGSVFRRGMRNRPYKPGRGTSAGETVAAAQRLPGAPSGEISLEEAERLLAAEKMPPRRTTAPR